jgi:hypothetical protein
MLRDIAAELDRWVVEQNFEAEQEGLAPIERCTIRVLGQAALMEADLPLALASTQDVDVRADCTDSVQKKFEELLRRRGRTLDPLGHEAWMPRETRYRPIYDGRQIRLSIAEPEAVLLSKALKAPSKNRSLITEYLAVGASERFLALARKYSLDLEQFV